MQVFVELWLNKVCNSLLLRMLFQVYVNILVLKWKCEQLIIYPIFVRCMCCGLYVLYSGCLSGKARAHNLL